MLKAAGLVLAKTYSKKMAKISLCYYLSDTMIKTPIDELAKDIQCKVFKKLHALPFLFILM